MYTGSGVYVAFGIILFLISIFLIFSGSTILFFSGLVGIFFSIILFYVAKLVRTPKPEVVRDTYSKAKKLPYKSPIKSALIAFIGGIFGLLGIGHMYVGKKRKGFGILAVGLVLFAVAITLSFLSPLIGIILSIGYIIMFIWQIFSATKLAKEFNETVKTTGKEPW